jgi:hypothetical protein
VCLVIGILVIVRSQHLEIVTAFGPGSARRVRPVLRDPGLREAVLLEG